MADNFVEMDRNPVLRTTTDGSVTNDGKPIHTLTVNATIGDVSIGNISASQSEGPTGDPVPAFASYTGFQNDSGDLVGVSSTDPLPVTGNVTVTLEATDIEIGAVEIKDGSSNNRLTVDASGRAAVDGSGVTQPISAVALPLPSGAATAANQTTLNTSAGNIDTNTSGLSRAEDSASASGDKGVTVFFIQKASPADLAGTDADYAVPQMSAGRIWTSSKIDTALPAGSNVIGHVIVDGTAGDPSVGPTGDPVPASAQLMGFDDGGDLSGVSATNPLPITGNITASNPSVGTNLDPAPTSATLIGFISGTDLIPVEDGFTPLPVTGNVQVLGTYDEDTASASGDPGIGILCVRSDTPANLSNANFDYEFPQMSAGRLWTSAKIDTALPAGSNVIGHVIVDSGAIVVTGNLTNISGTISLPTGASTAAKQPALGTAGTASVDVITVQGIASMTPILATVTGNLTTVSTVTTITNDVKVIGDTAADAALTVAPVTIGARATNANPTNMSAAGDVVNLQADLGGRLVTIDAPRELIGRTNTALSNTTTETTIIGATASTFHDLYGLILANTGATATEVSIRDDTAGTVMMTFYVPAGETRGFMVPASSATPQTAVNKNWTAKCANATTAMQITALYVSRV